MCPVCPREAEWVPAADGKMGSCGSWGGRPEPPPPPPQQQRNRLESTWGGCGPSVPGPPRGLRAIRSLAFFFFFFGQACGREPTCMCCWIHLLTVPADPARGHSPGGFKMASAPPLCRGEEEKGREGAAAQPPGLLCVGRSPLPVSAAASAASSEWVSTRRPRRRNVRCCWAYGGHFRDR